MTYAKTLKGDPRFDRLRTELAERYLELQTGRLLAYRVAWQLSKNQLPNYEASMSKVFGTEWTQRMTNTAMHMIATFGLADRPGAETLRARIINGYLNAISLTIAGGISNNTPPGRINPRPYRLPEIVMRRLRHSPRKRPK
jgi:alkylation response protein AidB-like acyl-CoA dehydrogenase